MCLFTKNECFLANIDGIKLEKVSGSSAPTMLRPPLILNEKRIGFPKKTPRFWNPQTWKLCVNVKFCSIFELLYCDDLLLEVRFVNFHAYFGGRRHHRSSRPEVFCEKGLRPATLLRRRLWHRCVPVNIAKFIKTPSLTEHLRWLLLTSVLVSFRTFNFCVFDEIKKIFAE